jgi:hypothetical protein
VVLEVLPDFLPHEGASSSKAIASSPRPPAKILDFTVFFIFDDLRVFQTTKISKKHHSAKFICPKL